MATTTFTDTVTLTAAAWFNDVDNVAYAYLTSPAGTNTITATGPKNLTYAAGVTVRFLPANTNTGATTINITPSGASALGAKNVFWNGAACVGGELKANIPAELIYDGTQFNIIGPSVAGTSTARASVYQYTAWDPSDVAGATTNASSSSGATSAATAYLTVANASGTVTFTCVTPGVYRFTIQMLNESAAAASILVMAATLGGSGTRYLGTSTDIRLVASASLTAVAIGGSATFYASMTATQTVTILPYIAVTSSGATTNFTQQCTISGEYVGQV